MNLWPQDDLPYNNGSRTAVLRVLNMITTYDNEADDDGSLDIAMDALTPAEVTTLREIQARIGIALGYLEHQTFDVPLR